MESGKETLEVYCDGGSRGNPGPAASAFVVRRDNKTIATGKKFLGIATNNFAEYSAVLLALKHLKEYFNEEKYLLNFFLDSELVVRQINGLYKIKNKTLINISLQLNIFLHSLKCKTVFVSIPRNKNKEADRLVNECLDEN